MEPANHVVVTDIQMRFGSMVTFMVKWTIAAIPAFLILMVLTWVFLVLSGVLLVSFFPDLRNF